MARRLNTPQSQPTADPNDNAHRDASAAEGAQERAAAAESSAPAPAAGPAMAPSRRVTTCVTAPRRARQRTQQATDPEIARAGIVVPLGAVTWGLTRETAQGSQRCTTESTGVLADEWPIADLTGAALAQHGAGEYRIIWLAVPGAARRQLGVSKIVRVGQPPPAAAAQPPPHASGGAVTLGDVERMMRLRDEAHERELARERERAREVSADKAAFYAAMLKMQAEGFASVLQLRQSAPAAAPQSNADVIELATRVAVAETRLELLREGYVDDNADDDADKGPPAWVGQVLEAVPGLIAMARARPAAAAAPAPAAPRVVEQHQDQEHDDDESDAAGRGD